MSIAARATAAYRAFTGQAPVTLTAPPPSPIGPTGERTRDRIATTINDPLGRSVGKRRRISPIAIDRVRWLRADVERAEAAANSGQLQWAAQIADWCKADLTIGGLLSTRCSVPRLPRTWRGDPEARRWLQGEGDEPGCFDEIFPPGELEELMIDHLVLGVGVGVFVQPPGQEYPRLVRLDNQFLRYQPGEDRYIYQGYGNTYYITPGDGVWVLHANGYQDPWRRGIWAALGYDQVSEDGAGLNRDAFIAKYGNPFAIATAAQGQSDDQKLKFWGALRQWTMGFAGVTPGHKVELLQPKAEGREVFTDAEARVERRAMYRIAGQLVTQTGGVGFANAEVFAQIASHLVARTGQDGATTLNTQAIPPVRAWAARRGMLAPSSRRLLLGYDTTPPQAREAEAKAIEAAATSYMKLKEAGFDPNAEEFIARFRLPAATRPLDATPAGSAPIFGYHIDGGITTINEVRATLGLPAVEWGDVPTGADQTGVAPVIAPQPVAEAAPAQSLAAAGPVSEELAGPDYAATIAAQMTEHGVEQCRHMKDPNVRQNRCRLCGVERADELVPGQDGAPHGWRIVWRAIAKEAA
jgi:hypothetical protein